MHGRGDEPPLSVGSVRGTRTQGTRHQDDTRPALRVETNGQINHVVLLPRAPHRQTFKQMGSVSTSDLPLRRHRSSQIGISLPVDSRWPETTIIPLYKRSCDPLESPDSGSHSGQLENTTTRIETESNPNKSYRASRSKKEPESRPESSPPFKLPLIPYTSTT